ncbi:hypothetical protein MMPV_003940 [Pyropia vietnamensis]
MADVDEFVDEIVRRVEWAAPIQAPPCAAGRAGDGDGDGDGDGGAGGADGNAMTGAAARFVAAQNLLLSWHRGKVPVGWSRPRTLADFSGGPGSGGRGGVAPPGAVEAARARIATLQRNYATARTEALSALVAGKRSAAAGGGAAGSATTARGEKGASTGSAGGAAADASSASHDGTSGSAAATAAATALRTAPSSATAAAAAASRALGGSASVSRGGVAATAADGAAGSGGGDGGSVAIASEDVQALRQLYDAFNADVSALTAAADKIAMTIADIALRTKALQDSI